VEQLGAGSRAESLQAFPKPALKLIRPHGSSPMPSEVVPSGPSSITSWNGHLRGVLGRYQIIAVSPQISARLPEPTAGGELAVAFGACSRRTSGSPRLLLLSTRS
jgi:hypothetical protein